MFEGISRILIIAVMLASFVGQATSFNSAMSCETSEYSVSTNHSEFIPHNDLNSTHTDNPEDCCGIECCDANCNCIANACSSFVYFNTEIDSTKVTALSHLVYIQQFEQPKSISNLLYRPPIFTS